MASFAAHYVTVLDYAYRTGDVAELERLSSPNCQGCSRYIDLLDTIHRDGGNTGGRTWSQTGSEIRFYPSKKDESFVTTVLTLSAGTVQMTAYESPKTYPASRDTVTFGARFDGGWQMTQFGLGDLA